MIWSALGRGGLAWLGWTGLGLAALGTALMTVSPFLPGAEPVLAIAVARCGVPGEEQGTGARVVQRPRDTAALVDIAWAGVWLLSLAEQDWHRATRDKTLSRCALVLR